MSGSEYAASVNTSMSCDGLAGWLQADEWRLDADAVAPLPSASPAPGAIVFPLVRWLALSRPGDAAIAKLTPGDQGQGCQGSIGRMTRQSLDATGSFATSTSALEYTVVCAPDAPKLSLGGFVFGDDGTFAVVSAQLQLLLGTNSLVDGEIAIGKGNISPMNVVRTLADGLLFGGVDSISTSLGITDYKPADGASGTATVTSIDPLIASVTLSNFTDANGKSESLTTGVRCDLPNNELTDASHPPPPRPTPTVGPSGHLEITVGNSLSASVDGPEVTCSFGIMDKDTWALFYQVDDPNGLDVYLYIPPKGNPSLQASEGDTFVQVDPDRLGGSLITTVDDQGSQVLFTAKGKTFDGQAVTIKATCAAVTRA